MRKLALAFATCAVSLFGAAEQPVTAQQYGYGAFGLGPMPILLPTFGLGWMGQWDHHGFDARVEAETVVEITAVSLKALYNYYPSPDVSGEFYYGAGLSYISLIGHGYRPAIAPQFVVGKRYQTDGNGKRFIEGCFGFPTVSLDRMIEKRTVFDSNVLKKSILWYPTLVVSYGIGF